MKLYCYYNNDGKIEQRKIEVKEKIVLVPANDDNTIPFLYSDKSIGREKIGELIGFGNSIFYTSPSFDLAKEKFLQKAQKEFDYSFGQYEEKKKVVEKLREQEEENAD